MNETTAEANGAATKKRSRTDKNTHEQVLKISQWVGMNAERLMKERPTQEAAAVLAAAELGFLVTHSSFRLAMRFNSIDWVPQRSVPTSRTKRLHAATHARFEALEKEVADQKVYIHQLDAEIARQRRLIHHLYESLGAKPPVGIHLPTDASRIPLVNKA